MEVPERRMTETYSSEFKSYILKLNFEKRDLQSGWSQKPSLSIQSVITSAKEFFFPGFICFLVW